MGSKYATDIDEIKEALAEFKPVIACIPALQETMGDMRVEMKGIAIKVSLLHDSCPYKGDIALAGANHKKLEEVEKEVKGLTKTQADDRLTFAKTIMQVLILLAGTGLGVDKLLKLNLFN